MERKGYDGIWYLELARGEGLLARGFLPPRERTIIGQAGEVHFHLGYCIIEHTLRDLGEEYEFNKTFRFNDERTRDNVAATLKAFGQEAFSGPDGHTSLRITEDGMAHLRILKGTTTYMKGVAEVVKSVLTCPGI